MLTNRFVYDLLPTLKPTDAVTLLYLLARTHGFKKSRVIVTLDTIAVAVHVSRSQARVSLRALDKRKLIRLAGADYDNPNPGLRGLVIDVLIPPPESKPRPESAPRPKSVPRSQYVPIKDRDYKREDLKSPTHSLEELEQARAEYERARAELEGK